MTIGSTTRLSVPAILSVAAPQAKQERILLVVDDDPGVCSALIRLLGGNFDLVLTAETAAKAVSFLNTLSITHLICDYWLGSGEPQGVDLIPAWRKQYPSIRRAVLYTANDLAEIPVPISVDRILSKSDSPASLVDAITG